MDRKVIDAAKTFIGITASLSQYERSQTWAEALHRARLGELDRFPEPLSRWLSQVVSYVDDDGPTPDYWPESLPWEAS